MKQTLVLPGIPLSQSGPDLHAELSRIWPEGAGRRSFGCKIPKDDPRARQILDLLEGAGLSPWDNPFRSPTPTEYTLEIEREYTRDELAGFAYLQPNPSNYWEGLTRDSQGRIELDSSGPRTGATIAKTNPSWIIVSDVLKSALESAGLHRISFRPTVLIDPDDDTSPPIPWDDFGPPFWELTSDLILPPLAPSCTVFDNDGNPFQGELANGCHLREGLYAAPELHYPRAAIEGLAPFDAALTHECLGNVPEPDSRDLIVSKSVRELISQHAKPKELAWIPVRLDDE